MPRTIDSFIRRLLTAPPRLGSDAKQAARRYLTAQARARARQKNNGAPPKDGKSNTENQEY
ncbi:hypothetical protein [Pyruvatibacter mobilis]|uniref:hypothetical protein n=1 Tax=Pyruvatibacter mobilis TaxID=1712261 RepID=UPI003BAA7E70